MRMWCHIITTSVAMATNGLEDRRIYDISETSRIQTQPKGAAENHTEAQKIRANPHLFNLWKPHEPTVWRLFMQADAPVAQLN